MTVPGFESKTASEPLEFRLQIIVEVCAPAVEAPAGQPAGRASEVEADDSRVARVIEAARGLLQDLSQGLDVRMASFTRPGGIRLVAQGSAKPQDLAAIHAAVETLARRAPDSEGGPV